MHFPEDVYRDRVRKFQDKLKEQEIDGAIIRALSSYTYFTGIRWLRPALLIPKEGEPTVLVVKNEKEGFKKRSWIKNIVEYSNAENLMAYVTGWIKNNGYKTVGLEYTVERDSFMLFLAVFQRLNPKVKIKDIHGIIMEQRKFKDPYEIESIMRAGQIAAVGREVAREVVKEGKTELEIAAQIMHELMIEGSEAPQVYVSAIPRIHAEPMRDVYVEEGQVVSVVIGADYNNYYVNTSRSFPIGKVSERVKRGIAAMDEAFDYAIRETSPGKKFIHIEKGIEEIYNKYGMQNYYIKGYSHGVGLLIEEDPITTIVVQHRFQEIKLKMVLAMVHAPLILPEGVIKKECTVLVEEDGVKIIT